MQRDPTLRESIFANDINTSDKGLIAKMCTNCIQLNTKKSKNPIKKQMNDFKKTLSQK